MGYPTGLISICAIEALHASWRGQKWSAAGWLGLGTSAAPTVVFVAGGMAIAQLAREVRRVGVSGVLTWGLWCGAAFSGLLLFIAYQVFAFHDPLAFIQAQDAWGKSAPVSVKLLRLSSPLRYIECFLVGPIKIEIGITQMIRGATISGLYTIQSGFQNILSQLCFWFTLAGLLRFTRKGYGVCPDAVLAGWSVFLGYAWFMLAGDQQMVYTARLLFPAAALFFGLSPAGCIQGSFRRTLAYLALISAAEAAIVVSGYWIL